VARQISATGTSLVIENMNGLRFAYFFFRRFPAYTVVSVGMLSLQGIFAALTVISIAPIVDLYLHPDLKEISPLTLKAVGLFKSMGIPATLWTFCATFLIVLVLKNVLLIFVKYIFFQLKYMVLKDVAVESMESFFSAKWTFFSSSEQGTVINTFLIELNRVGDAFGQLGFLVSSGSQIVIFGLTPLIFAPQPALICAGLAALFTVPVLLLGKVNYRFGVANVRTSNAMSSVLREIFDGAKVVKGFGASEQEIDRYGRTFDAHRKATVKAQALNGSIALVYEPLGMCALFATLLLGTLVDVAVSELVLVLWGLKSLMPHVGGVLAARNVMIGFLPSYEQLLRLKADAEANAAKVGTRPFETLIDGIEFDGVTFAYPNREPILNSLSLTIPKGKIIAIVGSSGTGKSTVVDLALGLNEPTSGTIKIDGVNLSEFAPEQFRRCLGFVPQDAVLFNLSVRDNLTWAKPDASEDEILDASRRAYAMEFIDLMPKGLDTLIGDRGVRLSGGQRQRLALARAIIRKPEILVLDEATSALDTHSERLIQQAIDELAGETTIVVVAHRLSTIVNADQIYVLQHGSVVESGDFEHLMEKDGLFCSMVRSQRLADTGVRPQNEPPEERMDAAV
jgi:ABC-type multidrug transport system fused ATPase/permease subunit